MTDKFSMIDSMNEALSLRDHEGFFVLLDKYITTYYDYGYVSDMLGNSTSAEVLSNMVRSGKITLRMLNVVLRTLKIKLRQESPRNYEEVE